MTRFCNENIPTLSKLNVIIWPPHLIPTFHLSYIIFMINYPPLVLSQCATVECCLSCWLVARSLSKFPITNSLLEILRHGDKETKRLRHEFIPGKFLRRFCQMFSHFTMDFTRSHLWFFVSRVLPATCHIALFVFFNVISRFKLNARNPFLFSSSFKRQLDLWWLKLFIVWSI